MKKIIFSLLIFSGIAFSQNDANLTQNSALNSTAEVLQRGDNNNLYSTQQALGGTSQLNSVQQFPATQNEIYLEQYAGVSNEAYFNQYSGDQNYMDINQDAYSSNYVKANQEYGSHWLKLEGTSTLGSNTANVEQLYGSGYANIKQSAMYDNTIPEAANSQIDSYAGLPGIYQNGYDNYIVGAQPGATVTDPVIINSSLPATQLSAGGSNWLEIWQNGDDNVVGLYQQAAFNNTALINQQNDNNSLAVYQTSPGGSNYLFVEQMGNAKAIVLQSSISGGYNTAVIIQD